MVKEAEVQDVEVTFNAGKLGMLIDEDSGRVTNISGWQAARQGVKVGWMLDAIDGEAYSYGLYYTKIRSSGVRLCPVASRHEQSNLHSTASTFAVNEGLHFLCGTLHCVAWLTKDYTCGIRSFKRSSFDSINKRSAVGVCHTSLPAGSAIPGNVANIGAMANIELILPSDIQEQDP